MDPHLAFVYGPEIRNTGMPNESPYKGKYFIYGKTAGVDHSSWYLDRDGIWNRTTIVKGEPVGYYDTIEAAWAVFDKYCTSAVPLAAE